MRLWLILLMVAAIPSSTLQAAPSKSNDPCREGGDSTACFVVHQQEALDAYGLMSAQRHLADGDEIRRAIIVNDYSQHMIAIQFIRTANREPTVMIYTPQGKDGQWPRPAISAAVPLADWDTIRDKSAHFDRSLEPIRPQGDAIIVCSHGWTYVVEVTVPTAESARERLRRRVENACDNGLAEPYANLLADTALRLLPPCLAIHRERWDSSAKVLAACAIFSGDRLAAAEVYNQISKFRGSNQSERERIQNLFTGTTLDWNGVQTTQRAWEAWLAKTSEVRAGFFSRSFRGESARRVLVEGALEYRSDEGEGGQLWAAPVKMTWEFDRTMGWLMRDAKVGAFVRTPSNCNPNLLTGGGNC